MAGADAPQAPPQVLPNALSQAQWVVDKSSFTKFVGLQIEELREGYCRSRLPRRPELLNQGGIIHGGLYAVVADHTTGVAASTCVGEEQRVLTAEYKLNILRPGDCDALVTIGTVIKRGSRLIIGEGKVYGEKDGGEQELLSVSLFTFAVVPRGNAGR